jgi:hypothetical protein
LNTAGTKRLSRQTASLPNIKNEKNAQTIFFTTTLWPLQPLSSFPTATSAAADDTTALLPCHHGAFALPCCQCHVAAIANPVLLPSCRHRRRCQADHHAAVKLLPPPWSPSFS